MVAGDDYTLRAEAYFQQGATANAPEILEAMSDRVYEAKQPGGTSYSYEDITAIILDRGGYTWTTGDMFPQDQQVIAVYAFSVYMQYAPDVFSGPLFVNFAEVIEEWRLTGYRESLVDYLRENWNP